MTTQKWSWIALQTDTLKVYSYTNAYPITNKEKDYPRPFTQGYSK